MNRKKCCEHIQPLGFHLPVFLIFLPWKFCKISLSQTNYVWFFSVVILIQSWKWLSFSCSNFLFVQRFSLCVRLYMCDMDVLVGMYIFGCIYVSLSFLQWLTPWLYPPCNHSFWKFHCVCQLKLHHIRCNYNLWMTYERRSSDR